MQSNKSIDVICDEHQLQRRRILEYIKDNFSMTLVQFVGLVRLNHARRRLYEMGEGAKVADSAAEAYISHTGRFSKEFLRIFGVKPSKVMRKYT